MKKSLVLMFLAAALIALSVWLLRSRGRVEPGPVGEGQRKVVTGPGLMAPPPPDAVRTEVREVTAEQPVEEEEAEFWEPKARSTTAPGGFKGRILWADGTPAANLNLWVSSQGFFDRQTGRRESYTENAPGLTGVLGEQEVMEEEPEEPEGSGGYLATDPKGRFRLEDEEVTQGYLWVDHAIGVTEAFDLRGLTSGITLRLRRTAPLTIACQGVEDRDRWKVSIRPTWRDQQGRQQVGSHLRRQKHEPSKSVYVEVSVQGRCAAGRGDVVVPVLTGVGYQVEVHGESFGVTKDESLIPAPGRRVFHLERRHIVLPYQILDADGSPSKESAWILIHRLGDPATYPARQRASRGRISWMDLQPGQRLRVGALLLEGEYLEQDITLLPVGQPQQVTFRRGTGLRPWTVDAQAELEAACGLDGGSALLACYVESRGRVAGMDFQSWFDRPDRAGFAIVVAGHRLYRLYIPGSHSVGRLLGVNREGSAWIGRAAAKTQKFEVKDLVKSPLEIVDTRAVHRAHGGEMTLSLEIEMHLGAARKWVTLERTSLPPRYGPWPVWEKQVPVTWKARLVLKRKASQAIHLPLGRR